MSPVGSCAAVDGSPRFFFVSLFVKFSSSLSFFTLPVFSVQRGGLPLPPEPDLIIFCSLTYARVGGIVSGSDGQR